MKDVLLGASPKGWSNDSFGNMVQNFNELVAEFLHGSHGWVEL